MASKFFFPIVFIIQTGIVVTRIGENHQRIAKQESPKASR